MGNAPFDFLAPELNSEQLKAELMPRLPEPMRDRVLQLVIPIVAAVLVVGLLAAIGWRSRKLAPAPVTG